MRGAILTSRKGNSGKRLEALVLASRQGATLVKVPNGVKYLPGGKTIPTKTSVDFLGCLAAGRLLALDAKECQSKTAFHACESNLKQHQVDQLVSFGRAGGVSGLLVLATKTDALYWIDWRYLVNRKPTYSWPSLFCIGRGSCSIQWPNVRAASNAAVRTVESVALEILEVTP